MLDALCGIIEGEDLVSARRDAMLGEELCKTNSLSHSRVSDHRILKIYSELLL